GIGKPLALVKAGSGRAYYIGLRAPQAEGTTVAVCVLARGTEEGTHIELDHPFTVSTNRAISFALYSSTIRSDRAGEIVSMRPGEEVQAHAPLVTVLRYGRKSRQVELPVRLSVAFTEVGTLELWCQSQVSDHRWRLQFQLRGAAAEGPAQTSASDDRDAVEEGGEAEVVISEEVVAAG